MGWGTRGKGEGTGDSWLRMPVPHYHHLKGLRTNRQDLFLCVPHVNMWFVNFCLFCLFQHFPPVHTAHVAPVQRTRAEAAISFDTRAGVLGCGKTAKTRHVQEKQTKGAFLAQ